MKRVLAVVVVLLLLGVAGYVSAYHGLMNWARQPLSIQAQATLMVEPGTSLYRLASTLEEGGWIEDQRVLRWFLRLHPPQAGINAGEYLLTPGMSVVDLIGKLQRGEVVYYTVTLVNGHTVRQFIDGLRQNTVLKHEIPDDMDSLREVLKIDAPSIEGWLYPDTYRFQRGDSDLDIVRRAYQRMQELLADAWAQRESGLPLKTPYEALILASIVERETGVGSERPVIAAVFINRLNRGMRLQTDPTVIYGLGDRYDGNITRKHLRTHTPYNTYQIDGLPPTPIANPALPAIEAVLHPAQSDYLYFVAMGDGYHQFSTTLEAHLEAVRRFQLNRRTDYRSTPGAAAPGTSTPGAATPEEAASEVRTQATEVPLP